MAKTSSKRLHPAGEPRDDRQYIWGQDRNEPNAAAHRYEVPPGSPMSPLGPMCARGWNRDDGFGFSIFRGIITGPPCLTCLKREGKKLGYVEPRERKTKWL
jgi:hypothetical protein